VYLFANVHLAINALPDTLKLNLIAVRVAPELKKKKSTALPNNERRLTQSSIETYYNHVRAPKGRCLKLFAPATLSIAATGCPVCTFDLNEYMRNLSVRF
jgi:hypothetical protein